jgi:stage III sporulation protein AE
MMGALYAMGGNVGAAVANHGVMTAFLSILQTVISGTVLPIAGICLAMALLDAVSGKLSLRPLCGLIKRTYSLLFSFLMLLLCGVLGIQTTLAKGSDTLALRTARFAAGSFLPVVGGSISEALRTVSGSVQYLRSVTGTGAILVLFFSFLPVFLSVLLTRIVFLLSGSAAKLLGCEGEEKILSELASVYGYFLAVIASIFVMTVFSLTLFARCATAGG